MCFIWYPINQGPDYISYVVDLGIPFCLKTLKSDKYSRKSSISCENR